MPAGLVMSGRSFSGLLGAISSGAHRLMCSLPTLYSSSTSVWAPAVVTSPRSRRMRWCSQLDARAGRVVSWGVRSLLKILLLTAPFGPLTLPATAAAPVRASCTHCCALAGPLLPAARGPISGSLRPTWCLSVPRRAQAVPAAPVGEIRESLVQCWVSTSPGPHSQPQPSSGGRAVAGARPRPMPREGGEDPAVDQGPGEPSGNSLAPPLLLSALLNSACHFTRAPGFRAAPRSPPWPFPSRRTGRPGSSKSSSADPYRVQPIRSA
ncbi:hypothetical protein NDU88_005197 [Pleurodeles waltl]|uniref:Secreted protein n=1 Tax=Pleurodeles waltl TaxID=8319 RepID=A0AAV7TUY0_PLEWA|nr:hypothetical protein NDU88_005197 [Pleurodeles waltl]